MYWKYSTSNVSTAIGSDMFKNAGLCNIQVRSHLYYGSNVFFLCTCIMNANEICMAR